MIRGVGPAIEQNEAANYRLPKVTELTGLNVTELLWLEHLGVFPSSACHHELGRFWLAAEVDDFARFLDEPGIREWMTALLERSEVHS